MSMRFKSEMQTNVEFNKFRMFVCDCVTILCLLETRFGSKTTLCSVSKTEMNKRNAPLLVRAEYPIEPRQPPQNRGFCGKLLICKYEASKVWFCIFVQILVCRSSC